MNKKLLSIIIILTGLIILLGIIYVFFASDYFYKKNIKNPVSGNEQVPKTINSDDVNQAALHGGTIKKIKEITIDANDANSTIKADDKITSDKGDLARIATSFTERFGTYSNQSNFSNIASLKIFMSQEMKKWSDQYIANQKKNNHDTAIYYGITTKAATTEIQDYDDDLGTANILVITRRREATGTTNNLSNVFTQNAQIDFIKENGSWKVNKASWME